MSTSFSWALVTIDHDDHLNSPCPTSVLADWLASLQFTDAPTELATLSYQGQLYQLVSSATERPSIWEPALAPKRRAAVGLSFRQLELLHLAFCSVTVHGDVNLNVPVQRHPSSTYKEWHELAVYAQGWYDKRWHEIYQYALKFEDVEAWKEDEWEEAAFLEMVDIWVRYDVLGLDVPEEGAEGGDDWE
ncbi:hypothetical protein BJ508DRAFT_365888 [Ascobolus immersus RN42]|uniref:Uncharacterized protein n=1 Tax=Ascobolus immersus RN42 TaxID=1160509 RepID=A0A3N4HZJ0_ASCIM|nr:hypothetical protein BJ508DRAFT_365888 [Ascobolus immersus RN42]